VWHNGGTGGYRSFIGFDPKLRIGVVVLSNVSTNAGVDDIGRHLLDASFSLITPWKERKEIPLPAEVLERYVGRYQLTPNFVIAITREDGHLVLQATGQGKNAMFAEGPADFFLKTVDAQVTFVSTGSEPATRLILHQNGRDTPADKIR